MSQFGEKLSTDMISQDSWGLNASYKITENLCKWLNYKELQGNLSKSHHLVTTNTAEKPLGTKINHCC